MTDFKNVHTFSHQSTNSRFTKHRLESEYQAPRLSHSPRALISTLLTVFKILIATLISRSCSAPHFGQFHTNRA